jgi:hypothetical protein
MVRDKFPKTVWANEIVDNVNVIARALRNVLLLKNPDAASKELDRVIEARRNINELPGQARQEHHLRKRPQADFGLACQAPGICRADRHVYRDGESRQG